MKKIYFALFLVLCNHVFAQTPEISWQKNLGGGLDDAAGDIVQTNDGGYIVTGYSFSTNGDVVGNHSVEGDIWVAKLNNSGGIEWSKCYGGSNFDLAYSIQQTADGGYIIGGNTYSGDGNINMNHGDNDAWLIKINATGAIQWQKTYGGSGYDYISSVRQTVDGGYIVAGGTSSTDGDVSGKHLGDDIWVFKTNANGAIAWQKCLGGDSTDYGYSVWPAVGGGYIVAGSTKSVNGDVTTNHGGFDCWVVKLGNTGNLVWQHTFGGGGDEEAYCIRKTADSGYVFAGFSNSDNGDVTGHHDTSDYWVVKLDSVGGMEWQKCLGGSAKDIANSINMTTDGGYLVAGYAYSGDGDVVGHHDSADVWVVKLDSVGGMEWQKCLGGNAQEGAHAMIQTADNNYIISGYTRSTDGDISAPQGQYDYWIVRLVDTTGLYLHNISRSHNPIVFPNPGSGWVSVILPENTARAGVTITNAFGAVIANKEIDKANHELYVSKVPGMYFAIIKSNGRTWIEKLTIQ